MSGASSAKCLFCRVRPILPRATTPAPSRAFHITPTNHARRKPAFANIRAVNLGLITEGKRKEDKAKQPKVEKRERQQPAYNDPRAIDKQKVKEETRRNAEVFTPYTEREKQLLALKYTPEQLDALEAAESSINLEDIVRQGRMRSDAMRINYKDDFAKILPYIDHPIKAPDSDIDPGIQPLSQEQTMMRFTEWFETMAERQFKPVQADIDANRALRPDWVHDEKDPGFPGNPYMRSQDLIKAMKAGVKLGIHPGDGLTTEERLSRLRAYAEEHEGTFDFDGAFERFVSDESNFAFSPRGLVHSQSDALSDPLPRMEDARIESDRDTQDPALERMLLQTGLSEDDVRSFTTKILVSHRVVNQTRLGKIASMYYLCIAGDGAGRLGIGEGKGAQGGDGAKRSRMAAIRNMKPILRYEQRTIFGEAEAKVGASIVRLSARPPGFGNRCQSLIFQMARAAGIKDLSARCLRSRNKMNVVKAAYAALLGQKDPEEVAIGRGRKMVDVRKVYYQGAVPLT